MLRIAGLSAALLLASSPSAYTCIESVISTATQIYADYRDQVGCMSRHLQRLLDTTLASEAGRDAIIMLHGDHGARVTFALDKPSDLLQTMFAIRDGREAQGRAEPAAASLQDLFAQTVRSRIP